MCGLCAQNVFMMRTTWQGKDVHQKILKEFHINAKGQENRTWVPFWEP